MYWKASLVHSQCQRLLWLSKYRRCRQVLPSVKLNALIYIYVVIETILSPQTRRLISNVKGVPRISRKRGWGKHALFYLWGIRILEKLRWGMAKKGWETLIQTLFKFFTKLGLDKILFRNTCIYIHLGNIAIYQ